MHDMLLMYSCALAPPSPGCQQVGVINAMRTGNVVFDMAIAMSIPLALQGLCKLWDWLKPRIEEFLYNLRRKEERFMRSIEYEKVRAIPHTTLCSSHPPPPVIPTGS